MNRVLGRLPNYTAVFIYGYFRRILVIFVVTLHWPFYQECCYRTTNFQPDDCNKIHSFLVSHLFYFLFLLVDLFPVLLQRPRKEMVPSVWHFFSSHHEKNSQRKNHGSVLIAFSVFSPHKHSFCRCWVPFSFRLLFDYWTERLALFKVHTNPDSNTVPRTGLRKLEQRPLDKFWLSSAVASKRLLQDSGTYVIRTNKMHTFYINILI